MTYLIKHALRASAGAFDSYSPEGWSPRLKVVVMGPVGADQELVWTVQKPSGKPWFEQRASVNELADEETQSFELSYWESEGDIKAAGNCAFTLPSDLSGGHTFTNSKGEPVGAEIIAAIEGKLEGMYRHWKGRAATAGRDDEKGPEMDDETTEALQAYFDRAERLLSTWAEDMDGGVEKFSGSAFDYQLQCEAVLREMDAYKELRVAAMAVPDDHEIEMLGESTTVGAIDARVLRMGELAQQHIGGAAQEADDALAPYRALLKGDKLAVFEDHPAPDFLYYTTNKKVIETPEELAAAKFWYFEGTANIKGTAEADGKKVKVSVDGWRVLGWKFDAKGKTLDEFEEQGNGASAPKTAFKHK